MSERFPAWMVETQCQGCPENGYCNECAQACFRRWQKCDELIKEQQSKIAQLASQVERYEKALKEIVSYAEAIAIAGPMHHVTWHAVQTAKEALDEK